MQCYCTLPQGNLTVNHRSSQPPTVLLLPFKLALFDYIKVIPESLLGHWFASFPLAHLSGKVFLNFGICIFLEQKLIQILHIVRMALLVYIVILFHRLSYLK